MTDKDFLAHLIKKIIMICSWVKTIPLLYDVFRCPSRKFRFTGLTLLLQEVSNLCERTRLSILCFFRCHQHWCDVFHFLVPSALCISFCLLFYLLFFRLSSLSSRFRLIVSWASSLLLSSSVIWRTRAPWDPPKFSIFAASLDSSMRFIWADRFVRLILTRGIRRLPLMSF